MGLLEGLMMVTAAGLISWLLGFLLSRPVDREISRNREFAGSLLNDPGELTGVDNLDELGALDLSLRRVAGQAHSLLERHQEEAARREAILGSMVEGVLAVDDRMHVTFCNQALARMAGGRTPATGTPVIELIRDTQFLETLEQVVRTAQPAKWHFQIPGNEGRSFEVQATPLVSGDSSGAVAILHDISELERLENVRRDFVANVSHEFRTPLAAITGYAETLLDGAIDEPGNNRRFLEIIRSNAIRLNSIATDLLTLSELQRGPAPPTSELIPIGDAIESALSTMAAEASLRKEVTLERGPILNLAVPGSRYQLEQALVNLLDNAVKFNQPDGNVHIETRQQSGQISILISDTGVGIPSNDLPRIFERFYRVDKARSRQVGGTGLGLSIVKHIVERMNGHVSATSQLGKGSVFTVTFPISS